MSDQSTDLLVDRFSFKFQFIFIFTSRWYSCAARKGPHALRHVIQQSPQGCPRNNADICLVEHRSFSTLEGRMSAAFFLHSSSSFSSFSFSPQDGIVCSEMAHTRSATFFSCLPKVALETMPIFVWLNTDRSRL